MPIILPFCLITNLFPNRSGLSNIIDIWHNSWIFWNPPSVFIEASPVSDSKINLFFGLSIKIQTGLIIDVLLCLGITLFFRDALNSFIMALYNVGPLYQLSELVRFKRLFPEKAETGIIESFFDRLRSASTIEIIFLAFLKCAFE